MFLSLLKRSYKVATIFYTEKKDVPKNKQVIPQVAKKYLIFSIVINIIQLSIIILRLLHKI